MLFHLGDNKMKYVGSKNKLSKELLPIINSFRKPDQTYVEPFVGGANLIDKIKGKRIAGDTHKELISMWKALQDGWVPPKIVSEQEYKAIRYGDYPDYLKGYVGFNLSFGGKWWGGYARYTSPQGVVQPFGLQAYKFVTEQIENIKGIEFHNLPYSELPIPNKSLIYCDPPYKNTLKYKHTINHEDFYGWCRDKTSEGHTVLLSEFSAPKDFKCIFAKERSVSLALDGGKSNVERLFVLT